MADSRRMHVVPIQPHLKRNTTHLQKENEQLHCRLRVNGQPAATLISAILKWTGISLAALGMMVGMP